MSEVEAMVARGIRYRYGRVEVLRGVDLVVRSGEALLLAGRNGAGKSTLLRVLAGAEPAAAGSLAIAGHDVRRDAARARRAVGYVPELPSFDAELSVREALTFHAHCAGLAGREASAAVESLLQLVDLLDLRQHRPDQLSRGQRQRLAIARALVHDPAVLLLDEPLAPLDAPGQAELTEVLYELKELGKALVVATRTPSLLADWADRLAVLADGQVTIGPVDQFRSPAPGQRSVCLTVLGDGNVALAALGVLGAREEVVDAEREPGDEADPCVRLRFGLRPERDGGPATVAALVRDLVLAGIPVVEVYGETPQLSGVE